MKSKQWKAIYNNDRSYDGEFHYVLSATKIVCRPSSTSRNPNSKNASIFSTMEETINLGFHPCNRCKPDQFDLNGYKKEVVNKTKRYIDRNYEQNVSQTSDEVIDNPPKIFEDCSLRTVP